MRSFENVEEMLQSVACELGVRHADSVKVPRIKM
jgi:hypothetical protein